MFASGMPGAGWLLQVYAEREGVNAEEQRSEVSQDGEQSSFLSHLVVCIVLRVWTSQKKMRACRRRSCEVGARTVTVGQSFSFPDLRELFPDLKQARRELSNGTLGLSQLLRVE